MMIECAVSLGELIDKITILELKIERINNVRKVELAKIELGELEKKLISLKLDKIEKYRRELKGINEKLWVIEDDIREKEAQEQFDAGFIELARSVYLTNDQRFKVKNLINMSYNSGIKEVKSYKGY